MVVQRSVASQLAGGMIRASELNVTNHTVSRENDPVSVVPSIPERFALKSILPALPFPIVENTH